MELPAAVTVTALNRSEDSMCGWVREQSTRLIEVWLDRAVPAGSLLKLESDSALFLGEVAACRPDGSGFATLLEMTHAIYNTKELARLMQRLLEER